MISGRQSYLDDRGAWQSRYVPAFVRRYPFVFSTGDDGKTFTLCIDEAFAGFNQEGRGQRLFDDAGTPTPYVQNVLKFLQEYQVQFRRTEAFCAKLKALSLLEPRQAQITPQSGARSALVGFSGVSRERLKALTGDALADLARTDELELTYLQMQSMRNFPRVLERGAAPAAPEVKETAPAAKDASPEAALPPPARKGKPPARKK